MYLNRIYDEKDLARFKQQRQETLAAWQGNLKAIAVPDALVEAFARQISDALTPPPLVAGLEVLHTGTQAEQHFSTSLITEFLKMGIVELDGDQLILHAQPEDLHYTVTREPGRWCLYCGEKLPDDTGGEMARLHVARQHKGVPSPSTSEPAGYQWLTYFECVLNERQHSQYKQGVRNG